MLFKIEAAVRLGYTSTACTDDVCQRNQCFTKSVEPAKVSDIKFYKASAKEKIKKRKALPTAPTQEEQDEFLQAIFESNPRTVGLCAFSTFQENFIPKKPVVNVEKVPQSLTMFYKEANRRLSSDEIQNLCSSCGKEMETLLSDQDIKYIEEVTRAQSTRQVWIEQRIGRITSSVVYRFLNTNQSNAAPSLIRDVRYKGQKSISSLPAVRHGIENENNAYLLYSHIIAGTPCPDVRPTGKVLMSHPGPHQDFTLRKVGLYISKEKPFLGASPDGIISCSCCGKGALEIKCPFKYISGLQGVAGSSAYCLSTNYTLKEGHEYYAQVQLHM